MKRIILLAISLLSFSFSHAKITDPNPKTTIIAALSEEKIDYSSWTELLNKYVCPKGKVDYSGFKKDQVKFQRILNKLSMTKITSDWTTNDKMAYWINVYNAFVIKLVIDNYPVKSIKEIDNPWKKDFFRINGKMMSLSDVEHGILRKLDEPRIHFAINCASASCPRLLQIAYTSKNLERLLERQTSEYINKSDSNTITENSYELSKIFSWFGKDFKNDNSSLIDFINKYSNIPIKNQKSNGFKKYNWELNTK